MRKRRLSPLLAPRRRRYLRVRECPGADGGPSCRTSVLCAPTPAALAACQDRLVEKEFLAGLGIPIAGYMRVDDAGAMARAVAELGRPRSSRRGVSAMTARGRRSFAKAAISPSFSVRLAARRHSQIVVPFSTEISVVAARGGDGAFAAYDVCENWHENHILKLTRAPARVALETAARGDRTRPESSPTRSTTSACSPSRCSSSIRLAEPGRAANAARQ